VGEGIEGIERRERCAQPEGLNRLIPFAMNRKFKNLKKNRRNKFYILISLKIT
jgi:hypothetical protein